MEVTGCAGHEKSSHKGCIRQSMALDKVRSAGTVAGLAGSPTSGFIITFRQVSMVQLPTCRGLMALIPHNIEINPD
jgi:hypothetical protein